MAPADGPLPAAAGDEAGAADPDRVDVVATLAPYLATLPPRGVRRMGLALRAVELLPFPWRFSRASVESRRELLERIESSGAPILRDLVLAVKVLAGLAYGTDHRVRAAVGYVADCRVDETAPTRPSLGDTVPPPGGEECDVAIVG